MEKIESTIDKARDFFEAKKDNIDRSLPAVKKRSEDKVEQILALQNKLVKVETDTSTYTISTDLITKCPYENILKQAYKGSEHCFLDFNSSYFSSIIEVLRKMQSHKQIFMTFNTIAEMEGCKYSLFRFFLDDSSILAAIQFDSIEKRDENYDNSSLVTTLTNEVSQDYNDYGEGY